MRAALIGLGALLVLSACRDDVTGPEARVAALRLSESPAWVDDGATLQLTATPLGSDGQPLLAADGVRIAWSSSDEGVASVSDGLVTGKRPGTAKITATVRQVSASTEVTVRPVPAGLQAVSGGTQTGVVGMPLAQALTVRLLDRHGNGVAGVPVEFVVTRGGGTVAPSGPAAGVQGYATLSTDAQGSAGVSWVLGTSAGENVVEARVPGRSIAPVVFTAQAAAGAAARLEMIGGDGQESLAGTQLPLPLVVRVRDAHGNPVAGAQVAWTAPSGGSVAPPVSLSGPTGEAVATWLLGGAAGEQTVQAQLVERYVAPVSFRARALAGATARLEKVSGDGQEALVTQALPQPLVVRAVDAFGNPAAGVKLTWGLAYGGGTIAPAASATDGEGYARAAWTMGTIMATHRLEVRAVEDALAPVSFVARARVGEPVSVEKRGGEGQEAEVGYTLPVPLVVRVTDAHGNPVPGVPVSWAGLDGGGAVRPGDEATDDSGLARGTWVLGTRTGTQTMTVTVIGKTTSFTAEASLGPSASIRVLPVTLTFDVGETEQLKTLVTDIFGNVGQPGWRPLVWTSSDPAVATVSASGRVSTLAEGVATITATRDGVSGSAHVTVRKGAVSIADLGTLGGLSSTAFGINAAGQVVGESQNSGGDARAFLWKNGVMTDLGTLGNRDASARAVNASGQVAGYSRTAAGETRAFLWTSGVMTDLGTLGGLHSWAWGMNDAGHVVGQSITSGGSSRAFVWKDGVMTDLGTLGGRASSANAINAAGHVVGQSETSGGEWHAFLWKDGVMTDLGTLGGRMSHAFGINSAGQVVGHSWNRDGDERAVLWQNGTVTELGTLGGRISSARAISESGQVVGVSTTSSGATRAFLWENGVMTDLGTLGGRDSSAQAINALGQVAGYSPALGAPIHAVLWTIR